jgi:hypothetical protein
MVVKQTTSLAGAWRKGRSSPVGCGHTEKKICRQSTATQRKVGNLSQVSRTAIQPPVWLDPREQELQDQRVDLRSRPSQRTLMAMDLLMRLFNQWRNDF